MKKATALSNDEIVATLLTSSSISEVADKLGVSTRTLYSRMNDNGFKGLYKAARNDLLRSTVSDMRQALSDSVATIRDVLNDKNVSAGVRLQAAGMVLKHAEHFLKDFQIRESSSAYEVLIYGD